MNKIILLAISVFLCSNYMFGQLTDELIIEFTSNSDPEENVWTLYSADNSIVESRDVFNGQETHFDTVMIDPNACYYWELTDSRGDGIEGAGSSQDGDYKIYLNGSQIAQCENTDFGKKATVYNLGNGCITNDIEVVEILGGSKVYFGEYFVKAKVRNVGAEDITSVSCYYTLNGEKSKTLYVDLSLKTSAEGILEYPVPMYLKDSIGFDLSLTVVTVNGRLDKNTDNNNAATQGEMRDGFLLKPLFEVFTSSSCGGCPLAAEHLDGLFKTQKGKYSALKYQVNWPAPGDPYYVAKYTGPRKDYYDIRSAPSVLVNGNLLSNYKNYTVDDFAGDVNNPVGIGLDVSGYLVEDSVFVQIIINSTVDITFDNHVLHTAIVEGETTGNIPNYNWAGQEEFHYVMMNMIPNARGLELNSIKAFEPDTITLSASMKGTFVEEMNDLKAVVFIQEKDTKEVLQSNMQNIPMILSINANLTTMVNTDFVVEFTSNKNLRQVSNSIVKDINDVVKFVNRSDNKTVEFTATFDKNLKNVVITPANALDFDKSYSVEFFNLENNNNVELVNVKSYFRTITGNPPVIKFSTDSVSEFGLNDSIFISSNEPLRAVSNGILDPNMVISLYKTNEPEVKVDFSASINTSKNHITVVPTAAFQANTEYTIVLDGVENEYDIAAERSESKFATIAVSASEVHLPIVKVYPNPSSGIFNVESFGYQKIEIYDLAGNKMLTDQLINGLNPVNVKELESGIYIVLLKANSSVHTQKLIIE